MVNFLQKKRGLKLVLKNMVKKGRTTLKWAILKLKKVERLNQGGR